MNYITKLSYKIKWLLGSISREEYQNKREEYRDGKYKLLAKQMKLGVAYNVFDGEELLEAAIRSIRSEADYVVVVYQLVSNFGEKASAGLETLLIDLKNKGLVDELYCYTPISGSKPVRNEKEKRDIGLELAKKAECNYFLCLDTDEFYDSEQVKKAKSFIVKNKIECSAVYNIEYIKEPIYQILNGYTHAPVDNDDMYNFYMPFIMKIHETKKQRHGSNPYCLMDPTRSLNEDGKFYLFPRHELALHHMSTIRKDLARKYNNSNFRANNSNKQTTYLKQLQQDILDFDFEKDKVKVKGRELAYFRNLVVAKVENRFNIHF